MINKLKITRQIKKKERVLIIATLILLSGILNFHSDIRSKEKIEGNTQLYPEYINISNNWTDSIFNSLTLEQKIAQMLMIPVYPSQGQSHFQETLKKIKKYNVGGIIYLRNASPIDIAKWNNAFQAVSKYPLLVGIDAEWGLAMRLDNTIKYPKQITLGAIQDNQIIYEMGVDIAKQCKRLGIHVNFAPVADINSNSKNPVINSRSFGEDRENVTEKCMAYMMGLQDNRILATAKHFPGHGDTDKDSHKTLPEVLHPISRLDSIELYPFKHLINSGLTGVMVAHLSVPALDSTENYPSTLSENIVDTLLKKKLGFKGLVFTDALNMQGVTDWFPPGDIEVKATKAGNDILLVPTSPEKAIQAIKKAVSNGIISEEQINESCKKIIAAKYWAGLSKLEPVKTENLIPDLNKPYSQTLKRKIAQNSITLVKNDNRILPLNRLDTLKIASVVLGTSNKTAFQDRLLSYTKISTFNLSKDYSAEELSALLEQIKKYNFLIISIHNTSMFASRQFGIPDNIIGAANILCSLKPSVFSLFANPYSLDYFKSVSNSKAIIVAYEDEDYFQDICAQMIFGALPFKGKLPVSVNNEYKCRDGQSTFDRQRLGYALPEELNINTKALDSIRSYVNMAIKEMAMPGCQILAAYKGKIFFNESFGYFTYLKKREVNNKDLYDIASITKISAVLPLVMRLYEQGAIKFQDPIKKYLPELDTTNKANLLIGDLLTHQAGLTPWIPFYLSTLEGLWPGMNIFNSNLTADYPLKLSNSRYVLKQLKYRDGAISATYSENFPIKIAENVFLNKTYLDTIRLAVLSSEVSPDKTYKYSDLSFYFLKNIVERIYNKPVNTLSDSILYASLGANLLTFLPLEKYPVDQITPTENDLIFRRQLIQGYVHDPWAAMVGGVAGHAGLFSNAEDLAKLMQMYLQGGTYGGIKFFDAETINLFASCPFSSTGNRRGFGFDKPKLPSHKYGPTCDLASRESFGHTGFTGTMAWVDPEYDLVYIFLSNRVHPDASINKLSEMDVRTNVQELFYKSLMR